MVSASKISKLTNSVVCELILSTQSVGCSTLQDLCTPICLYKRTYFDLGAIRGELHLDFLLVIIKPFLL